MDNNSINGHFTAVAFFYLFMFYLSKMKALVNVRYCRFGYPSIVSSVTRLTDNLSATCTQTHGSRGDHTQKE